MLHCGVRLWQKLHTILWDSFCHNLFLSPGRVAWRFTVLTLTYCIVCKYWITCKNNDNNGSLYLFFREAQDGTAPTWVHQSPAGRLTTCWGATVMVVALVPVSLFWVSAIALPTSCPTHPRPTIGILPSLPLTLTPDTPPSLHPSPIYPATPSWLHPAPRLTTDTPDTTPRDSTAGAASMKGITIAITLTKALDTNPRDHPSMIPTLPWLDPRHTRQKDNTTRKNVMGEETSPDAWSDPN